MISWEPSTLNDLIKYGFFAGLAYAYVTQTRRDLNGIGSKQRSMEGLAQRRWLHNIADQIDTSKTLEEAQKHAKLLREEAWRS